MYDELSARVAACWIRRLKEMGFFQKEPEEIIQSKIDPKRYMYCDRNEPVLHNFYKKWSNFISFQYVV